MNARHAAVARSTLGAMGAAGYAWLAYHGAGLNGPSLSGAVLGFAPLAALALWLAWQSRLRFPLLALLILTAALGARHADLLLRHYHWAYLAQHAGAMLLLGAMFGRTLLPGQEPLVTRFARHAHASLSPRLARYTRGVTWAWTLFFAAMTVASLALFAAAPRPLWALFAEGLTPLLVLALFVAEYLVRLYALPAHERPGPIQAVLAYLRYRTHSGPHAAEAPAPACADGEIGRNGSP